MLPPLVKVIIDIAHLDLQPLVNVIVLKLVLCWAYINCQST